MIVVADAGMLPTANLNALEDAGFGLIVGSRITRTPYDLAGHFQRHGNYFTGGQVLESARQMGTGKAARVRRVTWPNAAANAAGVPEGGSPISRRNGSAPVSHVRVQLHLAILSDYRHLGPLAVHIDTDVDRHYRVCLLSLESLTRSVLLPG